MLEVINVVLTILHVLLCLFLILVVLLQPGRGGGVGGAFGGSSQTVFGSRDVARWVGTASPPQYVTVRSNPGSPYLAVAPSASASARKGPPAPRSSASR